MRKAVQEVQLGPKTENEKKELTQRLIKLSVDMQAREESLERQTVVLIHAVSTESEIIQHVCESPTYIQSLDTQQKQCMHIKDVMSKEIHTESLVDWTPNMEKAHGEISQLSTFLCPFAKSVSTRLGHDMAKLPWPQIISYAQKHMDLPEYKDQIKTWKDCFKYFENWCTNETELFEPIRQTMMLADTKMRESTQWFAWCADYLYSARLYIEGLREYYSSYTVMSNDWYWWLYITMVWSTMKETSKETSKFMEDFQWNTWTSSNRAGNLIETLIGVAMGQQRWAFLSFIISRYLEYQICENYTVSTDGPNYWEFPTSYTTLSFDFGKDLSV